MARRRRPARARDFHAVIPGQAHQAAVGAVVAAIGRGDLFQANVARPWAGRLEPGSTPFDVLARLAHDSPAPFAGYLRLPSLLVRMAGRWSPTRPSASSR